jgi:REP element-mobilizing transposase RayT
MSNSFASQHLDPSRTAWHITFGTYGTRLHGSDRPTVDKKHNQIGGPFLPRDKNREASSRARMSLPARYLTIEQRCFAEAELPRICERGRWRYRICAAGSDHIHLLCDVLPDIHGEKVRRLLKRWLGQALSQRWELPRGATWWAEEGSNKAIGDEMYLNNCFRYIAEQRTTPYAAGAEDGPAR